MCFCNLVGRSCVGPVSQLRQHSVARAQIQLKSRTCETQTSQLRDPLNCTARVFCSKPISPKSFSLLLRTKPSSHHSPHSKPPFSTSPLTIKHTPKGFSSTTLSSSSILSSR